MEDSCSTRITDIAELTWQRSQDLRMSTVQLPTEGQAKEFATVVGDGTTLTFRGLHQCRDPYYIQPDMPARCKTPCHLFAFLSVAEKIGGADPLFCFAVTF